MFAKKKAVALAPMKDIAMARACIQSCVPIALVGAKGTGKTSFAKIIAEECGKELVVFSCNSQTSKEDILGRIELDKGKTRFEKSSIIHALAKGDFVLLDEVNTSLPEVLSVLQSLAETSDGALGSIHIPALGESVTPKVGSRLFIAYNEDYEGTTELNEAFLSRFSRINFEHPSVKDVEDRLSGICTRPEAIAVSAFSDCINAAMINTNSRYRVSMRECIQCARLLAQKLPMKQSLECTMLNHLNESELEAVYKLANATKGKISELGKFSIERLDTFKSSKERLEKLETENKDLAEKVETLESTLKSQKISRETASKKLADLSTSTTSEPETTGESPDSSVKESFDKLRELFESEGKKSDPDEEKDEDNSL